MFEGHLVLASASPRRRELLDQLGVRYTVHPVAVDETPRGGEAPADFVRRLALDKAWACARELGAGHPPVLGADTAVVVEGSILGKPGGRAEALAMLARLSGRTHSVFSGVALLGAGAERVALSETRVRFRALTPAEAEAYWATGEPADKAGAYAIQGLGAVFVAGLEGSYSGVVGLPLFETAKLLEAAGLEVLTRRHAP